MIHFPKTEQQKSAAHAAARDAGNASMREGNRTAWDTEEYNRAVVTYNTLIEK
jgi:hypothetical protein